MSQHATVTAIRHDNGVAVETLTNTELRERLDQNRMCVGGPDATWFPNQTITRDMARAACAGCPVIAECLELALRDEAKPGVDSWWIYGGKSPDERRAIILSRRDRQAVA